MNVATPIDPEATQRLALPPNAWAGRSAAQRILAFGLAAMGSLLLFSTVMMRVPGPVHDSFGKANPFFAQLTNGSEGIVWIALGAMVWFGFPSQIRRCVALILLMKTVARAEWALTHAHFDAAPVSLEVSALESWLTCAMYAVPAIAIWLGYDWGRRALVVVGIAVAAVDLTNQFVFTAIAASIPLGLQITGLLFMLTVPAGMIFYGAHGSTRRHFADLRSARFAAAG
jgi:hypothetical protein